MKKLFFFLIVCMAMLLGLSSEASGQCSVTLSQPVQPEISIAATNTPAAEPSTDGLFTVSVTTPVCVATAVTYSVGGTATQGTDYATLATCTIPAGGTSATIAVDVTDDNIAEPNETVIVTISSTDNAVVLLTGTLAATVTINDNDAFTVSLGGFTETESEATQNKYFVATMTGTAQYDVVFSISTTAGTATAGTDFTAISAGTATLVAGQTSVNIPVDILGDLYVEPQEAFTGTIAITYANGQQITIPSGSEVATVTINDNDIAVIAINSPVAVTEGTGVQFTATLTGAVQGGFTIAYSTADGTAIQPGDYTPATGTLNFTGTNGETQNFTVTTINDPLVEPTEAFTATLGAITNFGGGNLGIASGAGTGTGTINDNDAATISLAGFTVTETEATQSQNFTATMTAAAQYDVVLSFSTTAGTATASSDFTAVSGGTATILAGQTSVNIPVDILGDLISESQEAFTGTIAITNANAQQVTIPSGSEVATATIDDNDVNVTVGSKAVCDDATAVDLTVTITPNPGGGTVQFYVNGVAVGSPVTVAAGDGTASYTHNPVALTPAAYTIRADFSGYGQYSARSSSGVSDGTLTVYALPTFTTTSTDVTCFGGSDGSITATITSGPANYEYSLNNGSAYTTPSASPTHTFTGLSINAGSPYLIRVRDGNGCQSVTCP